MHITYYGHSCFWFDFEGHKVVVDPFISGNAIASHLNPSDIQADFIFLTHGHGDHIADVGVIASKETPIIANYEVASWFGTKGLNGLGMNHGGTWQGPFGKVRLVNAIHSSSLPDGNYGGNPCGFVFMVKDKTFYLAGDTCLTLDMKLIPELCGQIDFAIMPVGGHFTMDAHDAVLAAKMVRTKKVIGCHFDTFTPIKIDHQAAIIAFEQAGLELKLPQVGEQFLF
ncbi:MAG: metal-dependent hydrolase [Saprospiraceae bacterium]|nr:metal-dependent hydrolase [Saprospiraceae bacterium]